MSYNSSIETGDLIPRVYGDFRGIDATKRDVSLTRSPDALNMWIDHKDTAGKCIETRPGMELLHEFTNTIYGTFYYKVGNIDMLMVHSGTKLYKIVNDTITELYTGMNLQKSNFFVFNTILYIHDGINYKTYDGETLKDVVGYIPTTSISGNPATNSRTTYEWVNMLSDYRINTFCGDGESQIYKLDVETFDSDYVPEVIVTELNETTSTYDEVEYTPLTDYTWDSTKGQITFIKIPPAPATTGTDNVSIKYKKEIAENRNRIKYSTLITIFNDAVFMSGNPDYPNTLWWSSTSKPTYMPDEYYSNEGYDLAKVKALVPGNNALWVMKEPSQANTTLFYHTPVYTTDPDREIEEYVYPSTHSSISLGCTSTGINFGDDIVFFSDRGMEGVAGDVTTEQVMKHRSTLIDALLLNEENYNNMILQEWEGYLLIIIDNKIYLADSRETFTLDDHNEYDFFYWEMEHEIASAYVKDSVLYLNTKEEQKKDERGFYIYNDGTNEYYYDATNKKLYDSDGNESSHAIENLTAVMVSGIYTLTDTSDTREIKSYWTTPEDEFKVGQYWKTTNKRGCTINMKGNEVSVYTKTDNNNFEFINTYTNTKEYVVCRIKKKKWKSLQLKFESDKPFGLFTITLQAWCGGYVKR